MQFQVYFWGNNREIEKKTVIKHLDTFHISWLWQTAKELSDKGLSVMVNQNQSVLFVDTDLFRQK
jgi:hypothetical protein